MRSVAAMARSLLSSFFLFARANTLTLPSGRDEKRAMRPDCVSERVAKPMLLVPLSLDERDKQPEIMDQPGLEASQHQEALAGLARINRVSMSDRIVWKPILRLAQQRPRQTIRVLDIGTGGGDVLVRLCEHARHARVNVEFAGADISPTAIDFARAQAAQQGAPVEFFQFDALTEDLPSDFDVIMCSLFLHHLEADQAVDFLRRLGQATRGIVLVNDLIRSRVGYALAWVVTRALSRSHMVRVDGPLSVRGAFTMSEALNLARQAGLQDATIGWRWPFRFLLQWRRPND
jgi:2-polyprenyl-3-methyl-5-hydroxy-6-metoxy-1,4-benzoquinol methylase